MTQFQHRRLAITPLSPVHMGTGQDYEPSGYVIEDETLYEFDGVAALQVLPAMERERLGRILDQRPGPDMLRQVQAFFHHNRERLMAASRHQVKVNPSVEAFYSERVGQVAQNERGGGKVQNKLEIERTAYTSASGAAILPGSGLKGAIRTALLDAVNAGQPLPYSLKRDRQANRKLQEQLFKGRFHTDPLRMIRLGDAGLSKPDGFATEVRFALNRKKQAVRKDGVLIQSQAERRGLYQLLECVPAFLVRAFAGSLSIQHTDGVESRDWPDSDLCFRLPEIALACNRFYRPKMDNELTLLRNRGYLDRIWAKRLKTLIGGPVGRALDNNRAFLLRVGRHSGAESVTLNGLGNYIKIMRGGQDPEYLDHAKTLWLAGDERQLQTNLQPFGWLLVEPFDDISQLPPWQADVGNPDIAEWRIRMQQKLVKKAARLALERQREAEQERLEAEKVRRRREEERKREREERERMEREAAEAAHRQAEFDGLPDPLKHIATTRRKCADFMESAESGQIRNRESLIGILNKLSDEAESWTDGGYRREAGKLLENVFDQIGWADPGRKKKQRDKQEKKRREKIARLQQGGQA